MDFMDTKEIEQMFMDMGLGSSEQREKLVRELSINMNSSNDEAHFEVRTCSNTLNPKKYA